MKDLAAVPWRTHGTGMIYAESRGPRGMADSIGSFDSPEVAEAACAAHNADLVRRKVEGMEETGAAARAAGREVEAEVRMTHRGEALVALPGEAELVRVPAGEVAAGLGVGVGELPGKRVRVTVRESLEDGRVLSGWGPAEE